jgi:hypothetical protein
MGNMELMTSWMRKSASNIKYSRTGADKQFTCEDIVLSTFACFFAQDGLLLQFQRIMEDEIQLSNMKTLFRVNKIPTDNQIRNVLYNIDYKELVNLFIRILNYLKDNKLDGFRVLDNKYLLVVLDGSQLLTSKKINCRNYSSKEHRNGEKNFIPNVLYSSIVTPTSDLVIPLPPEFNEQNDSKKNARLRTKPDKKMG